MTTGSDTYMGMAVPLYGDFQIKGRTAATNIMTITQPASATGNPLVIETSTGTDIFVINASGDLAGAIEMTSTLTVASGLTVTAGGATISAGDVVVTAGDVAITNGYFLRFTSWPVTAPTTGLTKGDVFLIKPGSEDVNVGICVDSSMTVRYLATVSAAG